MAATLGTLTFTEHDRPVASPGPLVQQVNNLAVIHEDQAEPTSVTLRGLFATAPDWEALRGTLQTWTAPTGYSGTVLVVRATGRIELQQASTSGDLYLLTLTADLLPWTA